MQVHEIVDDARLEIILQSVDDDLMAYVDKLAVGEVCLVLVHGLVDSLVIANAVAKIEGCSLGILANVIG